MASGDKAIILKEILQMVGIIEPIAIALTIHITKKAIDQFWPWRNAENAPVLTQNGALGFTASHGGRTLVGKEFTVYADREYELVFGDLYIPDTVNDLLIGDEIPLVLISEETQGQVIFFKADLDNGYEIYLPHGIYSFYVFLVDPNVDDLFEAEIFAIGFPSNLDLSDIGELILEDADDIWDLLIDSPIPIPGGGPYYLDFILIDTDFVPEFPKYFSEL